MIPEQHPYKKLIIKKVIRETPDAKTFALDTEDGTAFRYQAGQFLTLVFPKKNGQEERRSFSFSSAPACGENPAITVKRIANGEFSRLLVDHVREGATFLYSGVSGLFTLPDTVYSGGRLFFFAAGSGITPVFSIIKTALKIYPDLPVLLVYSSRSEKDTIFYRQLQLLARKSKGRLCIRFLFSTAPNLLAARLNNLMITEMLQPYKKSGWKESLFFICGPFEYMDTVSITLLTEGVPKAHIRKENFSSFRPEIKASPPDKNAHDVQLTLGNNTYTITVQYPDSILTQALKEGLPLPYSCQSGQCGSCTAICTKGEVWMAYNEVLTDKELQQGMVLTCMGFPVNGAAHLVI